MVLVVKGMKDTTHHTGEAKTLNQNINCVEAVCLTVSCFSVQHRVQDSDNYAYFIQMLPPVSHSGSLWCTLFPRQPGLSSMQQTKPDTKLKPVPPPQPMQKWNGMFLLWDSELIHGGVGLHMWAGLPGQPCARCLVGHSLVACGSQYIQEFSTTGLLNTALHNSDIWEARWLFVSLSQTFLARQHGVGRARPLVSGDLWPLGKATQMLRRVNHSPQAFQESFLLVSIFLYHKACN